MQSIIQRSKVFLGNYPLFLFLLPVFFIYSGYNELFGFLSAGFVLYNFAIIIVVTLVVYAAVYFSMKEKRSAAIFTFFLLLFSLTFGFIFDSFKKITLSPLFGKYIFILTLSLVLFLILFFVLKKRKIGTDAYTFLNLLFIILILSEIPNSVKRYRLDKSVHNLIDFRFNAYNEYAPGVKQADSSKPDIYFLVFDAMASSKSMMKLTNKSITELDIFLRQKGFYVAPNAAANYNFTLHSLSTTFNMEYLPSWITPVMNDPKTYFWGGNSILDNSLFRILKKEGYSVKSYQPISFDNPDWPADSYFIKLKKHHFLFKTLPGRVYRDIFWNYTKVDLDVVKKIQYKIIEERQFEKKKLLDTTVFLLKQSCNTANNPKFVYAHFMIPHDPYIFDSTGHLLPIEQTIVQSDDHAMHIYYQQYRYAEKIIQSLVNYVQEKNKKNTVIIVAGDHGCKIDNDQTRQYRFNNYSAFYFPDSSYTMLYRNISPVNSFRVLLNKYFYTNYHMLNDSSVDVTEKNETIKRGIKITDKK